MINIASSGAWKTHSVRRAPKKALQKAVKALCFLALGLLSYSTQNDTPAAGDEATLAAVSAAHNIPSDLMKRAQAYKRPYGPRAPWNTPVAGLPRLPDSDHLAELLWHSTAARPGNFNLSFEDYTYPVYSASEATGAYTVSTRWPSNLDGAQIPWNPQWRSAHGTDGQVIVLDEKSGREWNLFQVAFRSHTVFATHANLVPGDYRTRTAGFSPSRGIGIQYLAMLVRPEEIVTGKIEHALSMPAKGASGAYSVPPATKLEHDTGKPGIPEGMRFALNATNAEIDAWAKSLPGASAQTRRSARIIATALKDYGWFITDSAGSSHFQFEANASAGRDWDALGLARHSGGARELPRDLLDGLITRDRIVAIVPSNQY